MLSFCTRIALVTGAVNTYILQYVEMWCVHFHRQLEAIIRISEALAKMSLSPFALDTHIDEALRLFQVSTLEAAHSGRLAGKWPWRWGGGV